MASLNLILYTYMKTAVVTGVSRGIGLAVAQRLLANGWKVYGLSRAKPSIDNPHFRWLQCDLQKHHAIDTAIRKVAEPTIDLLVSNAGVAFLSWASDITPETYEQSYAINILAPMLVAHALKSKISHATIISISSVSDRLPDADFALYCSSKAANTAYFGSLAVELTSAKVITLLPDYVDTPMLRELHKGDNFDWSTPLRAEDVARLIDDLQANELHVESGANIIIVNDALKEDLKSAEKLYGFNTDNGELMRLPGR